MANETEKMSLRTGPPLLVQQNFSARCKTNLWVPMFSVVEYAAGACPTPTPAAIRQRSSLSNDLLQKPETDLCTYKRNLNNTRIFLRESKTKSYRVANENCQTSFVDQKAAFLKILCRSFCWLCFFFLQGFIAAHTNGRCAGTWC